MSFHINLGEGTAIMIVTVLDILHGFGSARSMVEVPEDQIPSSFDDSSTASMLLGRLVTSLWRTMPGPQVHEFGMRKHADPWPQIGKSFPLRLECPEDISCRPNDRIDVTERPGPSKVLLSLCPKSPPYPTRKRNYVGRFEEDPRGSTSSACSWVALEEFKLPQ